MIIQCSELLTGCTAHPSNFRCWRIPDFEKQAFTFRTILDKYCFPYDLYCLVLSSHDYYMHSSNNHTDIAKWVKCHNI